MAGTPFPATCGGTEGAAEPSPQPPPGSISKKHPGCQRCVYRKHRGKPKKTTKQKRGQLSKKLTTFGAGCHFRSKRFNVLSADDISTWWAEWHWNRHFSLRGVIFKGSKEATHWKTNMSPKNPWLEDVFTYWNSPFLGDTLVFGGVVCKWDVSCFPCDCISPVATVYGYKNSSKLLVT